MHEDYARRRAAELPPVSEMSASQRSKLLEAMHAQVVALSAANNQLNRRVEDMSKDIDAHVTWITALQDANIAHERRQRMEAERSFIARLRWLVTGK